MTTTTKRFHLGDVLSITTGALVSPRHIGGVYDILNFMTGDNLFTHQLPRAAGECKPALLSQHPQLASVQVPDDFGPDPETSVGAWLATQASTYGDYLEVTALDPADHTRIDPLTELASMIPAERIIPVVVDDGEGR